MCTKIFPSFTEEISKPICPTPVNSQGNLFHTPPTNTPEFQPRKPCHETPMIQIRMYISKKDQFQSKRQLAEIKSSAHSEQFAIAKSQALGIRRISHQFASLQDFPRL